jgi:hypothetical protein
MVLSSVQLSYIDQLPNAPSYSWNQTLLKGMTISQILVRSYN